MNRKSAAPPVKEFDYRPNRWLILGLFLVCSAGAALFAYMAFFSEGGANARGIQLTEEQRHWIFRILLVLSPLGLIPIGGLAYIAWFKQRRLVITSESLLCPKPTRIGLSCEEIEIHFRDIREVSARPFMGSGQVLRIEHADGVVALASNMFPSKRIYEQAVNCVQSAVNRYHELHPFVS